MKNILSLALFVTIFYAVIANGNIKVAVTIDDLPTHGALPPGVTREEIAKKMLAVFKKHQVPEAYAFINAGKVETLQESFEVLKLWQAAGYAFGNHTYLHEDLDKIAVNDFKTAIAKNEPMLKQLSGKNNWQYFRYPFLHEGALLEKRNKIRNYLKATGYTIAQVTVDFEDWAWNNPYARCKEKNDSKSVAWLEKTYLQNADDILDRAEKLAQALFKKDISHILLLHIGAFDAEMLDRLLSNYEKKGVEFIPLSEAVKDEIYSFDPGVTGKWGSEFTYQVLKARNLTLKDVGMVPYTGYPESELKTICN